MKKVLAVSIALNMCLLAGYFVRDSSASGAGGGGGGRTPSRNGDVNCDGKLDISDPVYTLAFLFVGGPAPCDFDCPPPVAVCGNGVRELDEECDDSNTVNGDGCDSACRLEHVVVCGDFIIEGGEQCDDGNTMNGDGCSSTCQLESLCGDGVIEANEQCDGADLGGMTCQSLGFLGGSLGCSTRCELDVSGCIASICGDGVINGTEECDDANTVNGDGCDATCHREHVPVCGDGIVEGAEECDDLNTTNGDGCDASCHVERLPVCGDGIVEGNEECDDLNTANGDGCDSQCRLE